MPHYRATAQDGTIIEYDAALPDPEHLGEGWRCESITEVTPAPNAPDSSPQPVYGGRRTLTKLEFIELLGDAAYAAILTAMKTSIQIEAWVKKMELATPDANGHSVDMDDPRTQAGVMAIGMMLEAQGVVESGWAEGVLNA